VDAPEKVVRELGGGRDLERRDTRPDGVHRASNGFERPVFSGGVAALKNHQQRVGSGGVEQLLKRAQLCQKLGEFLLGFLAIQTAVGARVELAQREMGRVVDFFCQHGGYFTRIYAKIGVMQGTRCSRWSLSLALILVGLGTAFVVGCGGSKGGGGATPSPSSSPTPGERQVSPTYTIIWPNRSRALNPPASTRSLRITLTRGSFTRSELIDRSEARTGSYAESRTLASAIPTGGYRVTVECFADPAGRGASVAAGAEDVTIQNDGSGIGEVSLTGAVKSAALLPDQRVGFGQTQTLAFEARTASGGLLTLSPGSAFLVVPGTDERLRVEQGTEVRGLRPGVATVLVVIDDAISAPADVEVTSTASVTLSPERIELGTGQTTTLTAGTIGAAETGIDWSAPSGGSVTAGGVFTAPGVVGEFSVIARSRWDPKKLAQATIVVVPSVTVAPTSAVTTLRKTLALSAAVLGPSDTSVRWSVTEPGGGTVSANGLYTAPATPGVFHVVAESVADPRQKATVTITVQSGNGNITIQ
jgi:uncharacterized protein YjdB